MNFAQIMNRIEAIAKLADQLKPLLDKIPAGTLAQLVEVAVKALDKFGVENLAEKAKEAIEKAARKVPGGIPGVALPRDPMGCVHATCWNGDNAETRYMNMLSPAMSDEKFASYLSAMKERGADTVHLLLMNRADGENAGYSIYGTGGTGKINLDVVNHMLKRLNAFNKEGLRIGLWGVADDSNDWANAMLSNPAKYVSDLKSCGILEAADLFVLGLEMDEYGSKSGWEAFAKALREAEPELYLATHHKPGKYTYASLGDGVMGQLDKGCSTSDIQKQIEVIQSLGRDAWGFEYDRKPNRAKAEAALAKGAKGVGNW